MTPPGSPTWRDLRRDAARQLRDAGVEAADAEARWLLEEVSGLEGAELIAQEDGPATARGAHALAGLLERRRGGEPIQYVLGHWSFRGVDLHVDARVLIPRPETEIVAEVAIEEAVRVGARRGRNDAWRGTHASLRAADLGTGSGALALALVHELPDVEVWAVDVSADALAVARGNIAGIGNAGVRVRIAEGSWFDALPGELRGSLSLVVANPPYVAESEMAGLPVAVVAYEPHDALVSGPTGLEDVGKIVTGARPWLAAAASLVVEIAPHQSEDAVALARACGFVHVEVRRDLAGRDRVLVARQAP